MQVSNFNNMLQVRSLLAGEAAPKGDKLRDKSIRDYDAIVQTFRNVTSKFVIVKRSVFEHATPTT